jgi:hypothetical protein
MVLIVEFTTYFCLYIPSLGDLEECTTSDLLYDYNGSIEFVG